MRALLFLLAFSGCGAAPAAHKLLPSSVKVTHGEGGEFTICAEYHPPTDAGTHVEVLPP